MKRLIFALLFALSSVGLHASVIDSLLRTLPAELLSYVDEKQRQTLADLSALGQKALTANLLQGECSVDTLTEDYMHLTLSSSVELSLKLLPAAGGDSLVCLVKTWKGDVGESDVWFFNTQWQPVDASLCGSSATRLTLSSSAVMDALWPLSADETAQLKAMADFTLVSATLRAEDNSLVIVRRAPMVAADDKEKIAKLLPDVTLRWNGIGFER